MYYGVWVAGVGVCVVLVGGVCVCFYLFDCLRYRLISVDPTFCGSITYLHPPNT